MTAEPGMGIRGNGNDRDLVGLPVDGPVDGRRRFFVNFPAPHVVADGDAADDAVEDVAEDAIDLGSFGEPNSSPEFAILEGPPYLKVGGRVIYRMEDIEAYELEQLRLAPSPLGIQAGTAKGHAA